MKKLVVNLSQKGDNIDNKATFTVNIIEDAEKFSAKQFRKLFARAANEVLSLEGKSLGISKGRRFQMSLELEDVTVSEFTTFFNSNEKTQHKFNKDLKTRLNIAAMDLKDALAA